MAAAAVALAARRVGWAARARVPPPDRLRAWVGGRRRQSSAHDRLGKWVQLWQRGEDVFTLDDVNSNLVDFASELLPALPHPHAARRRGQGGGGGGGLLAQLFGRAGAAAPADGSERAPRVVLVPLCGRTPDLAWLAEGYGAAAHVVGLDAVGEPLRQFATEFGGGLVPLAELRGIDNARTNASRSSGPVVASYRTQRYDNLTLVHGDVFAVDAGTLGFLADAIWDRGGVTSMPLEPDDERQRYVAHLVALLAPGGRLLVEFLSCNLPLEGAASAGDVARLLAAAGLAGVRTLRASDVRDAYPSFRPPGLTQLDEVVLVAEKPGGAAAAPPAGAAVAS